MHASEMARKGYANTQRNMGSDTELELKIFTDITGRLAAADPTQPGGVSKLAEAVQDNARLWNLIFIDITNPENLLHYELKSGLVYLAEFVRQHTVKVLQGEAGHEILVEINKNVIAGKRGNVSQSDESEAA